MGTSNNTNNTKKTNKKTSSKPNKKNSSQSNKKASSQSDKKATGKANKNVTTKGNLKTATKKTSKKTTPDVSAKSGNSANKTGNGANKTGNGAKKTVTKSRKRRFLSVILKVLATLFVLGCLTVAVVFGITARSVGTIDPENIYESIEQTSYLYDVNGNQIDALHYDQDRKIVSITEMPDNLKNAFIAIEDKTFYSHHGFNFRRMFGAVLSSITNKSAISGTSTITQQLARNVYLSEIKGQRTIRRKLSEMYIAWKIEKALTKDQILEAYLNTIYLGYGNYGVNAAAKTYFSKEVSQLNLAQCAALAALPQAPDTYALISNEKVEGGNSKKIKKTDLYSNDISRERRELVLDLMVEQGYITSEEADGAKVKLTKILKPSFKESDPIYTYFSDYVCTQVVKDLMSQYGMSEEEANQMVYTGGLRINSTLDSEIQNIVCTEFENDYNFPYAEGDGEVQASMVITEVGTGRILAMAGGRNTSGSKLFNRAVNPRQPGSSIKPLAVYGAALQRSFELAEKGETFPYIDYEIDRQGVNRWGDYITAGSVVIDEQLRINDEIWPYNFSRRFSGYNTLRTALQQSINTCAVKILLQVGTNYSVNMVKKFGITTLVDDESQSVNDVNPAALALGAMTYGVTPLEMSLAYAVFPNGGVLNSPVCYTQVFDRKGKTILLGESKTTKVLDKGVAWIMTDLLKSVVSRGIAGSAYIWGTEVGGKTGTTNDTFDIWFDGFTPKYSASLWIGTDKNVQMYTTSTTAASLWSTIMSQIPDIREGEYDPMPDNVIYQYGEYYTKGTEPYPGYSQYNYYYPYEEEEEETDTTEEESRGAIDPGDGLPDYEENSENGNNDETNQDDGFYGPDDLQNDMEELQDEFQENLNDLNESGEEMQNGINDFFNNIFGG